MLPKIQRLRTMCASAACIRQSKSIVAGSAIFDAKDYAVAIGAIRASAIAAATQS